MKRTALIIIAFVFAIAGCASVEADKQTLPEYRLAATDGTAYFINFSEKWVWRGNDEQAELSDELITQLKENADLVISDKSLEAP